MTQLEKAREEIRYNTMLTEIEAITKRQIVFQDRVTVINDNTCNECIKLDFWQRCNKCRRRYYE